MTLFEEWTRGRALPSMGTNNGSDAIAFQSWHKFKESFAPELIEYAVRREGGDVKSCLDPFGGSGTTALAAQFLGIASTTVEINPFLIDVIRAKLDALDADALSQDLGAVVGAASEEDIDPSAYFKLVPESFIEPGRRLRWIFDRAVAARMAAILVAIDRLRDARHRRFFRVVLSGLMIEVSNVTVNGKGRRYRRNWQERTFDPSGVDRLFSSRSRQAIVDIHQFSARPRVRNYVLHSDARRFRTKRLHDLAIFSPPYPNSFDYTDVYNIELWMLGYLASNEDNRVLRGSTLTSHVQLKRRFAKPPRGARTLDTTLQALELIQGELWSPWIPAMVGAYFADLSAVLVRVHKAMRQGGSCWMVVGDSRYGRVPVPTAGILIELAPQMGWRVESVEPFRSMRSSSQQGGRNELRETLLILRRVLGHTSSHDGALSPRSG